MEDKVSNSLCRRACAPLSHVCQHILASVPKYLLPAFRHRWPLQLTPFRPPRSHSPPTSMPCSLTFELGVTLCFSLTLPPINALLPPCYFSLPPCDPCRPLSTPLQGIDPAKAIVFAGPREGQDCIEYGPRPCIVQLESLYFINSFDALAGRRTFWLCWGWKVPPSLLFSSAESTTTRSPLASRFPCTFHPTESAPRDNCSTSPPSPSVPTKWVRVMRGCAG